MDYLNIGPCPPEETPEQVGPNCDYNKMRRECNKYIELLRKTFGPEPEGCRLGVKRFNHDFGHYYEVVCYHSTDEGLDYALKCEGEGPGTWSE